MMPQRTLLLSWPVLLGLLGCSADPNARPATPRVRPLASASATLPSPSPSPPPPSAASIAPPAPWRSRRGECVLTKAVDDFVAAEEAESCGVLPPKIQKEEYERARACAIKAQAAHKPFRLMWGVPSFDSTMHEAVAGRSVDGRYEVGWFSYDSCPSGCGDGDPMSSSARCGSLVDLRAACKAQAKSKGPVDRDLEWLCDERNVHAARRSLELMCTNPVQMGSCGPKE